MLANEKIVIVGGCGQLGLPLGLVLATRGASQVTLLDIDASKVAAVSCGQMPFLEAGAEGLLQNVIQDIILPLSGK